MKERVIEEEKNEMKRMRKVKERRDRRMTIEEWRKEN